MEQDDKIQTIEALASTLAALGEQETVVLCHGVFDLIHIGHIRYFEAARALGSKLVVTLTPDSYVNKGPERPVFPQELRAEAIAALKCVDFVAINRWPTAVETIRLLKPDLFAKGSDYQDASKDVTGGIRWEREAIESVGGQLVFTDEITFSSSRLLNRHFSSFTAQGRNFLNGFKNRFPEESLLKYLNDIRDLKVLVIGEGIIDEYQYCETLGKSGKEPVLVARAQSVERFAGGTFAIANQLTEFANTVGLLAYLGTEDSHEDFIREQLDSQVNAVLLRREDSPTIVKRRFVEAYPFQKLFEVYVLNEEHSPAFSDKLCEQLEALLPLYDVVIVTDYGHGMLSSEAIEILCAKAPFLAVNVQLNAGSHGFNTVSKYRRADFICVSEREIRMEARSRRRDIRVIVKAVSEAQECAHLLITRGANGCLAYSPEQGFSEVPVFSRRIVDRVGAGDAVLAITSLLVAQGVPMEAVGFIGNAVGAHAVATVGHRSAVSTASVAKHLQTLLK